MDGWLELNQVGCGFFERVAIEPTALTSSPTIQSLSTFAPQHPIPSLLPSSQPQNPIPSPSLIVYRVNSLRAESQRLSSRFVRFCAELLCKILKLEERLYEKEERDVIEKLEDGGLLCAVEGGRRGCELWLVGARWKWLVLRVKEIEGEGEG